MHDHELPVLPGLRLIREVGRGGSGVVYAAERIEDGAAVAVKVLHGGSAEPRLRQQLRAEAKRAAVISHPGIVRVLDVGDDEELTWLVLELVDGPSLQQVFDQRGPLPPPLAAQVLAQAADAVTAIHAAGIAHGDLKPGNILLRQWPDTDTTLDLSAAVKVTDFGLARPLPSAESLGLSRGVDWLHTDATAVDRVSPAGTVAYMAPEQWRGEPPAVRSDVYALGGTLYAALTGERPFPRPSLPELAFAVATASAPAPSSRAAAVPPAMDAVVARAMAKEPSERYADAGELATAIRVAAGSERPADAATAMRRRRRWRGPVGRLLSPAGLLLALICFGSGFLTVSCTPTGYGHAAPGGTTIYTGVDLATGSEPRVNKLRPSGEYRADRLDAQPLLALAGLLLLGAAVAAVWPRRRHRTIATLAGSAAVALAIGEALARAELIDQFAAQLTTPLPHGRQVGDYVHVGNSFWASLMAATLVAIGHALAAARSGRRGPAPRPDPRPATQSARATGDRQQPHARQPNGTGPQGLSRGSAG